MNSTIQHPATFTDPKLLETIRAFAGESEAIGALHPRQLQVIYEQQWFKMYVPKEAGGPGLTLPHILRIEEALAWADGSCAWVVTLCSGAGWFYGFLHPSLAAQLYNNPHMCLAGSGAVTGIATQNEKGFIVNGCWKYASGSLHATAFTLNCRVKDGEELLQNSDGSPIIRSFLLKPGEVKLHRTWHSMGMIATGSHSFEANQVQVPLERSFIIQPDSATHGNIIFQYPFLQLAETTLAINLSGMAMRFIDLCEVIFDQTTKVQLATDTDLMKALAKAREKMQNDRNEFYHANDRAWCELNDHGSIAADTLAHVSKASHVLAYTSRKIVNELYFHCGLFAADTRMEINRVWRNFHTAAQHALFSTKNANSASLILKENFF